MVTRQNWVVPADVVTAQEIFLLRVDAIRFRELASLVSTTPKGNAVIGCVFHTNFIVTSSQNLQFELQRVQLV